MDIIKKIEKQSEKIMKLCQEIESTVETLNELPTWSQSIDDAIDRAREVQRSYELNDLLTDDQLQEIFNENKRVLTKLEEIRGFLSACIFRKLTK